MCELSEIEAMLRAHEEGLCSSIMRSLGSSAVTLFAVFDEKGKDRLELAGSGTLVLCGESHYILTAAHVWEKVLKSAAKVGITMTDNIDHQYLTDVAAIIPTTLPLNDAGWNEWGPDLAMLRIPPERDCRHRGRTAAARDHPGTRCCGVDFEAARRREWLHELSHLGLVARFDDHVQRVLATDDGFALDTDSVFANIGAAQVIEERRSHIRIGGRAAIRLMLVTDDKKSYEYSCSSLSFREEVSKTGGLPCVEPAGEVCDIAKAGTPQQAGGD
jgi:hypothetical protein